MKEIQNKTDASSLNDQLEKEIQSFDTKKKQEFQGYEPKENREKKTRKGKKKKTKGQIAKRVAIVLGVIILIPIAAFFGLRAFGKSSLFRKNMNMKESVDGATVENKGDLVIYKGHKYRYNDNITSILFMGVDRESINSDEEFLKKKGAGQADSIFLGAMDTSSGKLSLINVPRDIMTNVKTYDSKGKYTGTTKRQICLAYAYGDGKKLSCTNVVDSVSKVMYGIPIDSYMSINLSAISVLNDAVGGVNVQVIGDLTAADPSLKQGANVTLLGDQAEAYVRTREFDPVDANMARMQRQQQYIAAFARKALSEVKSDVMLPVDLFQLVSENAVTNLTASKLVYLGTAASGSSFTSEDIHNIECTVKEGKTGYAEYYPNEIKLFEMVLNVFYTKID
jgi:LCP family protein required for cell wall assembly